MFHGGLKGFKNYNFLRLLRVKDSCSKVTTRVGQSTEVYGRHTTIEVQKLRSGSGTGCRSSTVQ